jgi:MerR family transcriptional regulator/heat shock protein HspR
MKKTGKAYYMISAVAQKYNIHPQTLRLYEREGLLKPSRTDGNTRLYSEEDLEQLETILSLTRDLGVNLAGVEIILNMRRKIEAMQHEVNEFMEYVKKEMTRGIDDWEQRLVDGARQVDADRPRARASARSARRNPESQNTKVVCSSRVEATRRRRRRWQHAVRLPARDREAAARHRRRGAGARPAHPRGRRPNRGDRAGRSQPPLRRLLREALPRPRRVVPRPHPSRATSG